MGRMEGESGGRVAGKRELGMALGSLNGSRGQRLGAGKAMRNHGSWELPCWRFPYCLSVCHGISRPNKEEFK